MNKLSSFKIEGIEHKVSFVETIEVKEGVVCDVYTFPDIPQTDLGIISVSPGCSTPLQKVLGGESTIEGFISGSGTLTITDKDGFSTQHLFYDGDQAQQEVKIGECMQWAADSDSILRFYELCTPPYEDGRYKNLPN